MNFKKLLVAALPAMLLASCASDEPGVNPGGESTKGGFYATIKLDVPGSRSETLPQPGENTNSNAGYEVGKPYENNIKNLTVVLATLENGVYKAQTYGTYTSNNVAADPKKDNVYTIQFQDTLIAELAGKNVYVFAYCNTNLNTSNFQAGQDLNTMEHTISSEATGQGIWEKSNFMMVNAPNRDVPTKNLTNVTKNELLNNFNSPEKALNLGTVDVARTAARFDYKPVNNNLYNIVDVNSTDDPKAVVAQVEMVAMAPFNIAKDFYMLPRVSDDGTDNGWKICGDEYFNNATRVGNYVVSPNFAEKKANSIANLAGNYFQALSGLATYSALTQWANINEWYNAADTDDDNDENWNATDKEGYKIWRYVTENTIPQVDHQRKGITTGVVFKGRITNPAEGSLMAEAMNAGDAIYFYNGVCYGNIKNLRRVVANLDENATMRQKFEQVFAGKGYLVFTKAADGTRDYRVKDDALKDATPAENNSIFKIIRPNDEDGNYYVYYVYYNRHNDNGNSNMMGIMEFATVRNNVYKLSVTKVSDFGHTNDPKDDPDPENPEDPDETPKTYFQVSCRVLPWIVRINNIPF